MGQSGDLVAGLEDPGDLGSVGRGAPSGPIGHTHEVGLQLGDLLGGEADGIKIRVLLGREDLKGQGDGFLIPEIAEFHGDLFFLYAGVLVSSRPARRIPARAMAQINQKTSMTRG